MWRSISFIFGWWLFFAFIIGYLVNSFFFVLTSIFTKNNQTRTENTNESNNTTKGSVKVSINPMTLSLPNSCCPDIWKNINFKVLKDSDPSSFLPGIALSLSALSALAYEKEHVVHEVLKRLYGFSRKDSIRFFKSGRCQGFILQKGSAIVISIRGKSPYNPFTFLESSRMRMRSLISSGPSGMKVHSGFANDLEMEKRNSDKSMYEQIREPLEEMVRNRRALSYKRPPAVWVTGHGDGGAIATLCAFKISSERIFEDVSTGRTIPLACYSFGSPKIGNSYLSKHVNRTTYVFRVVNNNDKVCKMPRVSDFAHPGNKIRVNSQLSMEITLTDDSKDIIKPLKQMGTMTRTADTSLGMKMVSMVVPRFLKDHLPCEYVRELRSFAVDQTIVS